MKQLIIMALLLMASFIESRASGTLPPDTLYRFRFVRSQGMFYVPYGENGKELARLLVLIRQHRNSILSGDMPVFVDGFCPDPGIAHERSNRVKTELILRGGLRETCFRTVNHAQEGDFVEVHLVLPRGSAASGLRNEADKTPGEGDVIPDKGKPVPERDAAHCRADTLVPVVSSPSSEDLPSARKGQRAFHLPLSVRTNLLRLATLTADLGLEYRFAGGRIGLLVNGTFANWAWKQRERRYRIWNFSPEVRSYPGRRRRGFLGVMYQQGGFNYKLGETGKSGTYRGGGVTGGYRLPAGRHFAFDFHAALGYTRAEYDEYTRINGVNVRRNKDGRLVKNYWGINGLGVSFLYDF